MFHAGVSDFGISCFGFAAWFIASITRNTKTSTSASPARPISIMPLASPHAATGTPITRHAIAAQTRSLISGRLLRRREGLRVADLQVAAILPVRPSSKRTCASTAPLVLAAVQRVDQCGVLLPDEAPAHLARARQLAVVRVELLVQDEEAVDLRAGELGSAARSALTFSTHSRTSSITSGLRGEVGVAGVGQVAPLGPVADRLHVDVDEGADPVAAVRRKPPPP